MNCNTAAAVRARVRVPSPKAVSDETTSLEQSAPRKRVGMSLTLHAAGVMKAKPQPASGLARRDRLVLEHLPLVKGIARRVHENLPVHVGLDDLVHAGILGLLDAASKYKAGNQVVFSSYAKHRIKGAILDSLRQFDWA